MDQKKGQITVTVGDKKLFLLSSCELKAAALSENTSAGWWIRSPSMQRPAMQRPAMEGRGWHKAAAERGAKLRPDMQRGKVYLYQLCTTCFVEFDTMEQARAFRQYANENLEYWDYDPVATIDTNDPEDVQLKGEAVDILLKRLEALHENDR